MRLSKLKYKLIAIILVVTFIALFSYLGFVTYNNVKRLRNEMADNTITIARVTAGNLAAEVAFLDKDAARDSLSKLSSISYVENAIVYDTEGGLIAQYRAKGAGEIENPPEDFSAGFQEDYFDVYEKIIFEDRLYGGIFLRASTDLLNKKIRQSIINILVFILFLRVVIVVLSWRLQRHISNPIMHLAESFKKGTGLFYKTHKNQPR